MKYFQIVGGFGGFLLAFGTGIFAGNEIAIALRDGMLGCVFGALLLRGFHMVLAWSVRDFAEEKLRLATANSKSHEAL